MKIQLEKLKILNFKGVTEENISFSDKETNIYGTNKSGKSTVMDAFLWLLFGKIADSRKDFSIKPLDENNKVIPNIENEVTGTFSIDGNKTLIKKTHREKWSKKRGESQAIFTGNETLYEWNDVPLSQREFNDKVKAIVDADFFRIITNPLYFPSLHWTKKRNMITELIGSDDLTSGFKDIEFITEILNSGKTIEDAQKENRNKIKKIRIELDQIPTRINEAERSKPETHDWEEINGHISAYKAELEQIDNGVKNQLNAFNKSNEIFLKKAEQKIAIEIKRDSLADNLDQIYNKEIRDCSVELSKLTDNKISTKSAIGLSMSNIKHSEERIQRNEEQKKELLDEYKTVFSYKIKEDSNCKLCNSPIKIDIAPLIERQKNKLEVLKNQGLNKKSEIEKDQLNILSEQKRIKDHMLDLSEIEKEILNNSESKNNIKKPETTPEISKLTQQIKQLEEELSEAPKPPSARDLDEEKSKIQYRIDLWNAHLNSKTQIEAIDKRIRELGKSEKAMSQQIVSLEEIDFIIEDYNRYKARMIETEINKLFSNTKFKMFDEQVNGGLKEDCIILVNGVPFEDANTEAQLNTGLDIINVFTKHYDIKAPVFIDNRERVVKIIKNDLQIINLIVKKEDKVLRVE